MNKSGTIIDYKFTMSASAKRPKLEWIYQLNCYRWLYEKHGYTVNGMQVLAVLLDWSATRAEGSENYPQVGAVMIDIPRIDNIEAWIRDRIALHQDAIEGKFVMCTPEERWRKGDAWAVVRRPGGRAVKHGVFNNEPDAANLADMDAGLMVEYRPGRDLRCSLYCDVGASGLCEFKK